MNKAICGRNNSARAKIRQNAREGRRTLLICFYAGHGATTGIMTSALFNSNSRNRGNQYPILVDLGDCAKEKGAYVISLLACSRKSLPEEEESRGGTGPIESSGQSITIHAIRDDGIIYPQTPNLAQEFF